MLLAVRMMKHELIFVTCVCSGQFDAVPQW